MNCDGDQQVVEPTASADFSDEERPRLRTGRSHIYLPKCNGGMTTFSKSFQVAKRVDSRFFP